MGFPEIIKEPAIIWFLIGLICFIIEFSAPGVVVMFFGIGAWIVAILLFAFDLRTDIQIVIFVICSIASLLLLRKKLLQKKENIEDITDDFIGQTAQAQSRFTKGEFGKVIFKGASWKAETNSEEIIEQGDHVKIIGHESITLLVEPIRK